MKGSARYRIAAQVCSRELTEVLRANTKRQLYATRKEKVYVRKQRQQTSLRLKTGLAEMLKGGVIMDVMSVEQAEVAERPERSRSWRWSACPP